MIGFSLVSLLHSHTFKVVLSLNHVSFELLVIACCMQPILFMFKIDQSLVCRHYVILFLSFLLCRLVMMNLATC